MDKQDKDEAAAFAAQITAEAFETRIMRLQAGAGARRETPFTRDRHKRFNAHGCGG